MWRGLEIPEEWREHQSFEYHNFEKLDHNNEAHRKMLEEYWINTKEGDLVEGQPVYEAKHFK
jgi:elongation factor 1-gamma